MPEARGDWRGSQVHLFGPQDGSERQGWGLSQAVGTQKTIQIRRVTVLHVYTPTDTHTHPCVRTRTPTHCPVCVHAYPIAHVRAELVRGLAPRLPPPALSCPPCWPHLTLPWGHRWVSTCPRCAQSSIWQRPPDPGNPTLRPQIPTRSMPAQAHLVFSPDAACCQNAHH